MTSKRTTTTVFATLPGTVTAVPAGALEFRARPDSPPREAGLAPVAQLGYLIEAAARIEAGEPVPASLAAIFDAGSSLGGARPKAAVLDDGRQWLAKFEGRGDRWNVPAIEYATLRMARECGLNVPEVRLLRLPGARTAMLIERFDRRATPAGFERVHFVSGLTMLGVNSTETSRASYADLARVLEQRGVPGEVAGDRIELFRRMTFNILVSNDDDHLRNHGFLLDAPRRGWRLSPLYDVAPRPQAARERYLALGLGPRVRLRHRGQRGVGQRAVRTDDACCRGDRRPDGSRRASVAAPVFGKHDLR